MLIACCRRTCSQQSYSDTEDAILLKTPCLYSGLMKRILTVFSDFLDFMKNPSLHHRPQNRTSLPYWLVEPFKVPGSTDDEEQITLSADLETICSTSTDLSFLKKTEIFPFLHQLKIFSQNGNSVRPLSRLS